MVNITRELGQQFELLLTPAHNSLLADYLSRRGGDFYRWYVDWEMADVIQEALVRHRLSSVLEEFRKGMLDKHISKQFRNIANTQANLEHYRSKSTPSFTWNINYKVALSCVDQLIGIEHRSLRPKLLNPGMDLRDIFSNMQASAGVIAPGKTKEEVLDQILDVAMKIKSLIKQCYPVEEIWLPAIAFHRSQISNFVVDGHVDSSNIKLKDRFVWGEDGASVAVQGQYARPLIDAMSKSFWQYAGGKDNLTQHMLFYNYCVGKYWISTDISKFDQNVQSWLIHDAFELIKARFPESCSDEFNWIEYDFIHKKVIGYDGLLFEKDRGIPSGNYFTQIIGSICNLIMMMTYISSLCDGQFKDKEAFVFKELLPQNSGDRMYSTAFAMGDDNITFTRTRIDIKSYSTYTKKNFGVSVQAEKSSSGCVEPPNFLKRVWRYEGEDRPLLEFLLQLIHPEHPRQYDKLGYSPYHILYGLYCTYKVCIGAIFTEDEIIRGMVRSKYGLKPLLTLGKNSNHSVPGVLRTMTDSTRRYLYDRAIRRNLVA